MKKILLFAFSFSALLSISMHGNSQDINRGTGLLFADSSTLANHVFLLPPRMNGGAFLENLIDFSDSFPPPESQGAISSCSSWATGYAMRSYLEKKKYGYSYLKSNGDLDSTHVFSPLFIYNQVRDHSKRCDSSSSKISDNLDLMMKTGICKLPSFDPSPYAYPCCEVKPLQSPKAVNEAASFKIDKYGWVFIYGGFYSSGARLDLIRRFLSAGYPVVLGLNIDSSFYHNGGQWEDTCWVWRHADNRLSGQHAVVCVGYNEQLKAIKILNSWGNGWGNKGYGYIGEDLIDAKAAEGYVVNPGKDVIEVNGAAILSYGLISEHEKPVSRNFAFQPEEYNFFIRNRYQPYENTRIMPVDINHIKKTAVFKVYEVQNNRPIEIDVFVLHTGENYVFLYSGFRYDFKFIDIKRWNGPFSKYAAYYTIKVTKG